MEDDPKSEGPANVNDPLTDGGDAEDPKYTSHVVVPLAFMERLEAVAKKINNRRRRTGRKKRALGWFVVTHLESWLRQAEERLENDDADPAP